MHDNFVNAKKKPKHLNIRVQKRMVEFSLKSGPGTSGSQVGGEAGVPGQPS